MSAAAPYINETTKARQRQALLQALQSGQAVSTVYAREVLGISHPAGRVFELRRQGYGVTTAKATIADARGRLHTSAVYRLTSADSGASV